LLSGLDQVHGLAFGPDGKVYVGETGKISRFAPGSSPVSLEPVVTDLPRDGLHPLTTMIFDAQGALIVNIGAPTDRCELKGPGQDKPQDPCPFLAGTKPRAALWRLTFDKPGGKVVKTEVLATGLRNSMALAVDGASGTVLQAENSADLPGENEPPEEINLIKQNKNYGWPHCVGANQPLLGTIPASRCKAMEPAAVLLPAHAAPLGMLIYRGDTLPGLKGRLVVGYHGYRDNGHRIVSFALPDVLNAKQNALSMPLVSGWQRQKGLRPRGAPVGLAEAADGTLWFVEDKNRTIMAIRADETPGGRSLDMPSPSDKPSQARPMPDGFDTLARDLLSRKCAACHVEMRDKDPAKSWGRIVDAGWAEPGPLRQTKLIASMLGDQGHKPMPPPLGLKADAAARKLIEDFLGRNP
ncbi:MAG TPA: hypothetical protein DCL54_00895, partial [Alphaproteobacteria bacterium]|nr:hypothetical protein [Alphaproteobacteria bacterium]